MSKSYYYVRFRWMGGLDFDELAQEFKDSFRVETVNRPVDDKEISVYKKEREKLKVKADTLGVLMAPFRAVLYQRIAAPFTKNDMRLRERILELYPRKTASFFPWHFGIEPKFEIAEDIE